MAARIAALEKGRGGRGVRELHLVGDAGGTPCAQGHQHCLVAWRYPTELPGLHVFTRHIIGTNIDELG